ncbi:hypothetical protein [Paenibacillus hamazuiensis]|nr:hypothetical protein [Paenibacillus hamazuiensis]
MLQVAARSKWAQTWVNQTAITFRFSANGRGLSFYGDCNVLTL